MFKVFFGIFRELFENMVVKFFEELDMDIYYGVCYSWGVNRWGLVLEGWDLIGIKFLWDGMGSYFFGWLWGFIFIIFLGVYFSVKYIYR